MDAPLTGVVPVAPTIFHDDQAVDLGGTARVVDYLMDAGSTGCACSPTIPSSSR
jgi:2-keto-3-deoxy-L-arabinonate dehydratase